MAGLASRLASRGHQVSLVTFEDSTRDRHPLDPSVHRVSIGIDPADANRNPFTRIRKRHRGLKTALGDLNADVILSFCDRTNIDVLMAAGKLGIPIVVSERSDPNHQSLGVIWNTIRQHVYPRAAQVIALTEPSARLLRCFCGSVHVIPSAVDIPQAYSDRDAAGRQQLIVGAGRFAPEKGFDRLISAFASVAKRHDQWRLTIFGDGPLRNDLQSQSRQLGIENRVSFPGWVTPLQDSIRDATIFGLSSRYEGFPSVLLEAMSMGIPVVSVDCESGPREIVTHESNGLLMQSTVQGLAEG